MADILIRNLDVAVVEGIDSEAKRLGLSRSEFLRRELVSIALPKGKASKADFERFADLASDLLDDEVMSKAWD
ncbi:ribbon-helix-helix protein, CopG family [uncultured Agrococcus sp.]|uniref:type II toxin-antitoxin system VapB family antitoxin n=1 Tax=uncultured Agrococcus sp. TaxID=382258 RepID=UPI0025FBB70E|nr:ribbon-helix-helix protein, CopG family [uncultured Agrococcus sp.]